MIIQWWNEKDKIDPTEAPSVSLKAQEKELDIKRNRKYTAF